MTGVFSPGWPDAVKRRAVMLLEADTRDRLDIHVRGELLVGEHREVGEL